MYFTSSIFRSVKDLTFFRYSSCISTVDDPIRFIDVMINYMHPHKGKPGPNLSTIQSACRILITQEKFRCETFKFADHYRQRLHTFLDQYTRAGRSAKGVWKRRQYVGFMMISRIAEAWLQYYLNNGINSWDLALCRLMSVLLVSCTAARAGDIARSQCYEGLECLKWEDIHLFIDDSDPTLLPIDALQMHMTLRYTKNRKDVPQDNIEVPLARLSSRCSHCDPILLLLIHALHFGLVEGGPSIDRVLDTAMSRNDRTICWVSPKFLVCPAFAMRSSTTIEIEQPARAQQITHTLQSMAVVSGLLTHVTAHSLRYGSVRDIAHLRKTAEGYSSNILRQMPGHCKTSGGRGTY